MTLGALFLETANRRADEIAIYCEQRTVTYAELATRASAIAVDLRAHGLCPGESVGILVERSEQQSIAMLGVLLAGGAFFVPATDDPPARIRSMLQTASARLVLMDRDYGIKLPDQTQALPLSTDARATVESAVCDASTIAHIPFTSGSTGEPKGARIRHSGLINLLSGLRQRNILTPDDRVLAQSTASFDAGIRDLLFPLLLGGSLIIATDEQRLDPLALQELIALHDATYMSTTPTFWRLLLTSGFDSYPKLKAVSTGEPLSAYVATGLLARCKELWNLYGPAETTMLATAKRIVDPAKISVGPPFANVAVEAVGESLQQVASGTPGELVISGAGVGDGYINRPDQTARAFVRLGKRKDRAYRTGDLGTCEPSGEITVLGRIDRQIKCNGVRLEPRAIEEVLNRLPGVRESAVRSWQDGVGAILAAYLVPSNAGLDLKEVQAHARSLLPSREYPARWTVLQAFPLTSSLKLNLEALPPPSQTTAAPQKQEGLLGILMAIWQQVLGQPELDAEARFMDAGGSSLAALRVLIEVRKQVGLRVTARELLQNPRLSTLATRLAQQIVQHTPLNPEHAAVSFQEQQFWLLNETLPHPEAYHETSMILLQDRLDLAALEGAFHEVVEAHVVFRHRYAVQSSLCRVLVPQANATFECCHVPRGEDMVPWSQQRVAARMQAAFDLGQDAPIRGFAFFSEQALVLAVGFHHIATDGHSIRLFWQRWQQAYKFAAQPETATYTCYLQRQQARALNEGQKDRPDAPLASLPLPQRRERQEGTPITLRASVAARDVQRWQSAAQGLGQSETCVFLAAAARWLQKWFDQQDFAIAVPVSLRSTTEDHAVLGCCINTVLLRSPQHAEFASAVLQLGASLGDALQHAHTPIAERIAALRAANDGEFHVLACQYHHELPEPAHFAGHCCQPLHSDRLAVNVPIRLECWPRGDQRELELVLDAHYFSHADGRRMMTALQQALACPTPDSELHRVPATWMQAAMWLETGRRSQPELYHVAQAYEIRGPLQPVLLEQAVQELIARHDALSLNLQSHMDTLYLTPQPTACSQFEHHDLQHLNALVQNGEHTQRLQAFTRRPFDLRNEAPVRLALFRLGLETWQLHIVVHHASLDGWATALLLKEIADHYHARTIGAAQPSNGSAPSFLAHARRLHQYQNGPKHAAGLKILCDRLAGLDTPTAITADFPATSSRAGRSAVATDQLGPADTSAIEALVASHRATPMFVLFAATFVLLQRHTGQHDLLLTSVFHGRREPSDTHTIGPFVEILPARVKTSPKMRFAELLQEIIDQTLLLFEAGPVSMQHADAQLAQVVGQAIPFAYQDFDPSPLSFAGCDTKPLATGSLYAHRPIAFFASPDGNDLQMRVTYDQELFQPERIDAMLAHWLAVIQAAVHNPEATLQELPDALAKQSAWITNPQAYPRNTSIGALFIRQASETPDAPAIRTATESLTYRQLAQRVASHAAGLHARGIQPADRIGICMQRSTDLIVAIFATVSVGAAYVPLDPEQPNAQQSFMIEDAQLALILVHPATVASVPDTQIPCVGIETLAQAPIPLPTVGCDSAAYLMYTSGTSGKPKGSLIPQRGVIRLVCSPDYADLSTDVVLLQLAVPTFDAATFEIFGALLNGGTLGLLPPGPATVREIADSIQRFDVTHMFLTASLFSTIVDERLEALRPLQHLLVGGEAVSPDHMRRCKETLPDLRLSNAYGPTENTTFSTAFDLSLPVPAGPVPIGRPIANSEAMILDADLRLCPIGSQGDLYLGGDGLCICYWRQPARNAQAFVPNPLQPGARLYRTGDRARWLPDGTIQFLGRKDQQVKLRGYRVELTGVEAVISQVESVARCAAAVISEGQNQMLAVALVPHSHASDTVLTAAGSWARQKLPTYMRPQRWKIVDDLPRTDNGKLDRSALAHLFLSQHEQQPVQQNQHTPLEYALIAIWQELFPDRRIDATTDFFAAGGNSLLAIRMVAKIEQTMDRQVSLPQMFQYPSVRALAEMMQAQDS